MYKSFIRNSSKLNVKKLLNNKKNLKLNQFFQNKKKDNLFNFTRYFSQNQQDEEELKKKNDVIDKKEEERKKKLVEKKKSEMKYDEKLHGDFFMSKEEFEFFKDVKSRSEYDDPPNFSSYVEKMKKIIKSEDPNFDMKNEEDFTKRVRERFYRQTPHLKKEIDNVLQFGVTPEAVKEEVERYEKRQFGLQTDPRFSDIERKLTSAEIEEKAEQFLNTFQEGEIIERKHRKILDDTDELKGKKGHHFLRLGDKDRTDFFENERRLKYLDEYLDDSGLGFDRNEADGPQSHENFADYVLGMDTGNRDPVRGSFGTFENPTIIYSAGDHRYVGCVGAADSHGHEEHELMWMVLRPNYKHACHHCGQHFKLITLRDIFDKPDLSYDTMRGILKSISIRADPDAKEKKRLEHFDRLLKTEEHDEKERNFSW